MKIRAVSVLATLLLSVSVASAAPAKTDAAATHGKDSSVASADRGAKPSNKASTKPSTKGGTPKAAKAKASKVVAVPASLLAKHEPGKAKPAHGKKREPAKVAKVVGHAKAAKHAEPVHHAEPTENLPSLPASLPASLAASLKLGRTLPPLRAEAPLVREPAAKGAMKPSCLRPPVSFVRGKEEEAIILTRCDGSGAPLAAERLSVLARAGAERPALTLPELAKKQGDVLAPGVRRLDGRLVEQMQLVVDHFGKQAQAAKKPIKVHLVSGFRPNAEGSFHANGRALDFRIDGVDNTAIVAVCKTLDDVGCGYYPNSTFVHMDVRTAGTGHVSWIDASGPGESPRYVEAWPPPKGQKPRFLEAVEDAIAKLDGTAEPSPTERNMKGAAAQLLGALETTSDRAADAPAAALTVSVDDSKEN